MKTIKNLNDLCNELRFKTTPAGGKFILKGKEFVWEYSGKYKIYDKDGWNYYEYSTPNQCILALDKKYLQENYLPSNILKGEFVLKGYKEGDKYCLEYIRESDGYEYCFISSDINYKDAREKMGEFLLKENIYF